MGYPYLRICCSVLPVVDANLPKRGSGTDDIQCVLLNHGRGGSVEGTLQLCLDSPLQWSADYCVRLVLPSRESLLVTHSGKATNFVKSQFTRHSMVLILMFTHGSFSMDFLFRAAFCPLSSTHRRDRHHISTSVDPLLLRTTTSWVGYHNIARRVERHNSRIASFYHDRCTQTGRLQDGMRFTYWAFFLRHLVGVWHTCGEFVFAQHNIKPSPRRRWWKLQKGWKRLYY